MEATSQMKVVGQVEDSSAQKEWRKPQWRARNVRTHC